MVRPSAPTLTDEIDRVAVATALKVWRRGGPIELEDLKQHARLAALEALPKHNGTRTLPGFIANAVRWRIADLYRHEQLERAHRAEGEHDLDAVADGHDLAEERAEVASLLALVAQIGRASLSRRAEYTLQLVIRPAALSGRTHAEIERDLGFRPGRIKKESRRMRDELLAELHRMGVDQKEALEWMAA